MPRESPWSKPEALDKLHAYMKAPVFPWNVLFEPLPEPCLEHYAEQVPVFHWMRGTDAEEVAREVKVTCQDYLVNPDSPHAQEAHRGCVHEYPFAYSQVRVFGSLQREGRSLFQVIDVPGVARLLGRQADDIRELEARVARLAAAVERRPRVTDTRLRGKALVDSQGTPLGEMEDLLHEGGLLVEVRVRPLRDIRHPGVRRIGDSLAVSLDSVRLWSPFHNAAVLLGTV